MSGYSEMKYHRGSVCINLLGDLFKSLCKGFIGHIAFLYLYFSIQDVTEATAVRIVPEHRFHNLLLWQRLVSLLNCNDTHIDTLFKKAMYIVLKEKDITL